MQRAYDPTQTIRDPNSRQIERLANDVKREMENGVSRSSLVHGTQTNPNSDTWYDTDAFLLDQVKEVLNKLSEGSIDDEIWGKIVIMERCKRVAKAYLRKTTVIIDGSEDEFDGKTLGFNHFENSTRDDHTKEIRAKIADGVILRMDYQGNIKGMARGATPIVCQGWKEPRSNCISDRLVRLHGKLNHGGAEEDKAYKVFDMRKFKHSLEREIHDGTHDARALLLKTCLRIALVKDGGDMNRTPCWFAVVNLVALDMVKEKLPTIKSLLNGNSLPPVVKSSGSSGSPDPLDAQTLTQIIAAAVSQANKTNPSTNTNSNLAISPEQLAQIASTISIAQTNTMRTSDLSTMNKNGRKKPYHCSTSSLDSSGEDSSSRRSEIPGVKGRAKRWENANTKPLPVDRYTESPDIKIIEKTRALRSHRPLLQDAIFTRSHSITSDYDSNKEHFDSGSWSSTQSRYKLQGGRSTSSSVVSDHDIGTLGNINRNELKECTEIKEANSTTDDEQDTNPSPAPNVPTLPRKDYNMEIRNEEIITEKPPTPTFTPQPESHIYENQHVIQAHSHAKAIEIDSSPIQTPTPKFPSSLVRRISSVCDHFLPKLEGTPTWTANSTRNDEEDDSAPPLPPPLPETPLPDGISASQQYNAFNSHPTFYNQHHKMGEFHSRNSEEVEVYFGRTPDQPDQQRNRTVPFVSELRQVLEQRTNGFRIARNHSQPATAHPSLRQYATKNNQYQTFNSSFAPLSSGRNTPERTPSQISNSQIPRGLRRTFNEQFHRQQSTSNLNHNIHQQAQPQQHQHQPQNSSQQQNQRVPNYNYAQSTLCREQAPVARVNRTGSLPWGQWQHMRRTHM